MAPPSLNCVFTYGTLRDDDDSGAPWTHSVVSTVSSAFPARVRGLHMYQHPGGNYPYAVITDRETDMVVGRVLVWEDAGTFRRLLTIMDDIENYNERNPEGSEYLRLEMTAEVEREGREEAMQVYVYCRRDKIEAGDPSIPEGDWLKRPRV